MLFQMEVSKCRYVQSHVRGQGRERPAFALDLDAKETHVVPPLALNMLDTMTNDEHARMVTISPRLILFASSPLQWQAP